MYDIVCNYLVSIVDIMIPLIFIRIILDAIRNYIFKN